jgi:hypothetical protein
VEAGGPSERDLPRLQTPRRELEQFIDEQVQQGWHLYRAFDELTDDQECRSWTHDVERWDALTKEGLRTAYSSDSPAEEFTSAAIGGIVRFVNQTEMQTLGYRREGVEAGVHTLQSLKERLRFVPDPEPRASPSSAGPAESRKALIFLSHSENDSELAMSIRDQLANAFDDRIPVFVSSDPEAIPPGTAWVQRILAQLRTASAVVLLATAGSLKRGFVWFEIGASWDASASGELTLYTLCTPDVSLGSLPPPLNELQATSLADPAQIRAFAAAIVDQFQLGSANRFDCDAVADAARKYGPGEELPPSEPSAEQEARKSERRKELQLLYILSHDGIAPEIMAGERPPPSDWIAEHLHPSEENPFE